MEKRPRLDDILGLFKEASGDVYKDEHTREVDRTKRVIADLTSNPKLAPEGLALMKFDMFMLKRKNASYPLKWFTFLRESAAKLYSSKGLFKSDESVTVMRLCFPSRPNILGGRSVELISGKLEDKRPCFEIKNIDSLELLFSLDVKQIKWCDSELELQDIKWIQYTFKTMKNFFWFMLLLYIYDEKANKLILDDVTRKLLADTDVLQKLEHECFLDSL